MAFKRGFKAEAERIAEETRTELDLGLVDPLDTFSLAEYLGIPVYGLKEVVRFSENATFVHLFSGTEQDSFSAMTVFAGTSRTIIHNETHAATRQLSNIAHEISHCLLEHSPMPISNAGSRYWKPDVENEASWLGGSLLVPREGALRLALEGMGASEIAAVFGVSEALCRWRIAQRASRIRSKGAGSTILADSRVPHFSRALCGRSGISQTGQANLFRVDRSLRRGRATQQSLRAQVLVQVRPMNPVSPAGNLPIPALGRSGV